MYRYINFRRRIHFIGMCLVLAMMVSSCKMIEKISEYNLPDEFHLSPDQEPAKETAPPSNFKKMEISIIASTLKSFHPYAPQESSMDTILKLCYQSLMVRSGEDAMVGQLAEEVILSEDTLSCEIDFGEKTFHDGTKLTPQDIQYSFKLASTGRFAEQVSNIEKITAVSDRKVRIDFRKKGYLNLYQLDFPIVKNLSLEKGNPLTINGTGVYQLEEYKPKQSVRLKSAFNQLLISLNRSEENHREAFLHGLTDVYFTNDFEWLSFSEERLKNISVFPGKYFYYMGFQSKNPILAESTNRNYLAEKLDLEKIRKNVFLNHILPQKLPFPMATQWEKESNQEARPNTTAVLDTNPILPGEKLRVIYPKTEKLFQILAKTIEEDWSSYVGIELIGLEEAEYQKVLQNREFDVYLAKMETTPYPNLKELLVEGGRYNYSDQTGYGLNLEMLYGALQPDDLKNNYLELARKTEEAGWMIPFGIRENAVLLSNQVEGSITPRTFDYLSGVAELKIKQQ